jgi:hypothetical protein
MLARFVHEGASGELVAASGVAEVHVYVLGGRIAWGTSSSTRSAFTQYLSQHCGVDAEALREAIAESQQRRTRLGETLLSWGLVTQEDLRGALEKQIASTLEVLASMHESQALFLPRRMEYAAELTFGLDEVWPCEGRLSVAHRVAPSGQLSDLARAFPEALWTAVIAHGDVTFGRHAGEPAAAVVRELDRTLHDCGQQAIVVRSAFGGVLGAVHASRSHTLWVALPPEAKLGVANTLLHALSGRVPPEPGTGRHPVSDLVTLGGPLGQVAVEPLRAALRGAEQLLVALVTSRDGRRLAVARLGVDVDAMELVLRQSEELLSRSFGEVLCPRAMADVIYERVALSLENPAYAAFQTVLATREPHVLSLVFERSTAPGLSWALLSAISRQLND